MPLYDSINPIVNMPDLEYETHGAGCLKCPRCGDENLHHDVVNVFNRSEDNKQVRETMVNKTFTITMNTDGKNNPSPRRDGLSVHFWCENCSKNELDYIPFSLSILQHKGGTFVKWIRS